MKRKLLRLVALVLVLGLVFSGCTADSFFEKVSYFDEVAYDGMVYTRPDMEAFQAELDAACQIAETSRDVDEIMDAVYDFYEIYDSYITNYNLSNIRYSADLTDSYWEEEYNFCAENSATVDAGLEQLYCTLAKSPLREQLEGDDYFGEGFFLAYEEQTYDETLVAMLDQEAALISRYYDLSDQALQAEYYSEEYFSTYGLQMEELFVEMIRLRQKMATYMGYDSFPEFAYDFYFVRDYTPDQAEAYLTRVGQVLYDPYVELNGSDVWDYGYPFCNETQTFQFVKNAANAMGGTPKEAFGVLEANHLYDIAYGENKFNSSFETYLWTYRQPFVFMNPQQGPLDKLTFGHEFGHFCNDYVCGGSYAGTDVAEIHSQTFEYLSLVYGEDTRELTQLKMADSLCTYVEQAAYALFEHQVYGLTGDQLTAENVRALYTRIGTEFGFDSWAWDSRDYVVTPHFFTQPMYVVSYVVSNDVAMQIYELELEKPGAGLELYEQCLQSQESYIIFFTEEYGLQSPFAENRLEEAAKLFGEK